MAKESGSSAVSARVERTPPYSEEAEQGVLGSILLDSSRVMDLCLERQIIQESFYVPANRTIYAVLMEMAAQGTVSDIVTVTERLKTAGTIDGAGGSIYLERLIDSTPTAAHAEYYVEIIRQKHLLRCVIDCAREAEQDCYSTDEKADVVLSRAEQAFLDITERQHGFMMPWNVCVKHTMEHIENIYNGSAVLGGIPTGFHNLDKIALGLRGAEMVVLAARPSMGKTSLAMNIAENIALARQNIKTPVPVCIFSLEMSQEAMVLRMLCGHAEVSSTKLTRGYVDQNAHRRLTQAASVLSKAPLYLDDTGGLDILELRARARRMKKKYDIGMIMIDYLQLLRSKEFSRQGKQVETSDISGNIKAMAKELNIPVLVLSQLSRAPEQRDKSGKPKLSDLRDSGAIEQDADMVWMLRRPCKYPDDDRSDDTSLAILEVVKQRNGPTGEVELNFEDELTRFRDRAYGVDDGMDGMTRSDDMSPPGEE